MQYRNLFSALLAKSQMRTQRKINGWNLTAASARGARRPIRVFHDDAARRCRVAVVTQSWRFISSKGKEMQSIDWTPEHSAALREHLAKGMSFSAVAAAINEKFGTAYSRSATIGRAKRMGLARPDRREAAVGRTPAKATPVPLQRERARETTESRRPRSIFESVEMPQLRCADVVPRHLSLLDLERRDCRYPYGGDEEGEAITFCGHPRRRGSSYCSAHFHLTIGPGTAAERAVDSLLLKLVETA
jgi:GcrA cell cycle regulator